MSDSNILSLRSTPNNWEKEALPASDQDAEGTYTYTHDSINELTGVTEIGTPVETHSYDLNGNRTGTGYSTGTENQQTASLGATQPDYPRCWLPEVHPRPRVA
jgi:hypothetical protein